MRILAIDPGTTESAFVVFDTCDAKRPLKEYGYFANDVVLNEYVRQTRFYDWLAIEQPQMCWAKKVPGKLVADLLTTREWVGRFDAMHDAQLVPARSIRKVVCGNAKAADKDVRAALVKRFGEPGTKKKPGPLYGIASHLWSALAIAVYVYDTQTGGAD